MRPLTFISDLHIDVNAKFRIAEKFVRKYTDFEGILVIAGDWCEGWDSFFFEPLQLLFDINPTIDIVFVPGNHDYYGNTLDGFEKKLSEFGSKNTRFHPLVNDFVYLNNYILVGGTLWYPDHPDVWLLKDKVKDFNEIKDFTPQSAIEANYATKNYNFKLFDSSDEFFMVWITHHAPSYQSIVEKYRGNRLNCYFYDSAFAPIILQNKPHLLIHGHVHSSINYQLGSTRVLANPHGYGDTYMENPDFDWYKHIIWT